MTIWPLLFAIAIVLMAVSTAVVLATLVISARARRDNKPDEE